MTSQLYDRTMSVFRPAAVGTVGAVAYGGMTDVPGAAVPALVDLACTIQFKRGRSQSDVGLPSDPTGSTAGVEIWLDRRSAGNGDIKARDIVVDDLGNRFIVIFPYWTHLGYRVICNILEA